MGIRLLNFDIVSFQEADIAAGALSIKPTRIQILDFSYPFMEVGIAAVIMKASSGGPISITSPYQLANQSNNITYGLIPGSQTYHYFRLSNHSAIQQMWHQMMITHPSAFEWTSKSGVERVRNTKGKYVFFVESSFAQYLTSKPPCDLTYLSELLNPSQYALAFKKGSVLKKKVNNILETFKVNRVLEKLQNKWWKRKCVPSKKGKRMKNKGTQTKISVDTESFIHVSTVSVPTENAVGSKHGKINKYYNGYSNSVSRNYVSSIHALVHHMLAVLCVLLFVF